MSVRLPLNSIDNSPYLPVDKRRKRVTAGFTIVADASGPLLDGGRLRRLVVG